MKHIKGKFTAALGLAAGYVLGSRAGRDRYEKIKSAATGVWKDPRVQDKVQAAEEVAKDKAQSAAETVKDKATGLKDAAKDKATGADDTDVPTPGSTS